MLIAISQRHEKNKHGMYTDTLENSYVDYLERLGILLIPISNTTRNVENYFAKFPIEGIILTGGNKVNPELYGEHEASSDISDERDSTEKKLLDIAIKKNLPVLGLCRGCQFISVYFGGKLVSDIRKEAGQKVKHVASNHDIAIIHDELKKILGDKITINSYHNQGITEKTISQDLGVFARAADGTIEGIYHKKLPIAGIIWHPERKSPDENANIKIINLFMKGELFWKKR